MKTIKDAKFIRQAADFGEIRPVFKKVIWLDKPVRKATLFCSALGYYEAYLNNQRVGKFIFAPGWTTYGKRLQYQEYNVTNLLEECNTLDIALGNGMRFHGNPHENYESITSREDALIAALVIEYEDGTEDFIPTDETWKCSKSNIVYSHVYNGETVDFTMNTDEEFPVKELPDINMDILIETEGEEVREMTRLNAIELIKTPKGETVIDFGQNLTGYVEWNVPAKKGKEFKLYHAEILDKDGNFYTENLRGAKAQVSVISDGVERAYKPHFSFQGFRYIKLEGFENEDINLENFTAVVVFSDMKRIGYFACGNDLVQQLYENIVWGLRGNFLDVPTDCPQRDERLGWTGDAQVFARTASTTYRTDKFFRKWLHDLAADQRENGAITDVCPDLQRWESYGSSAWADASVIVPYQVYAAYGDKTIIEEQFESMKKWIDFMENNGTEKGLFDAHEHHFGDWLSLDAGNEATGGLTDKNLIGSAYLAYSNSLFIKMGKAIGKDMSYYEDLYEHSIKAYRKKFLNTGKTEHETQTSNVLALHFNLTDNREREAEKLVKDIEACGHLKTGFVGTPYLLHTLTEIGRADLAYKLLLRKEFPSWLFPVTRGSTTMWERWDGMKEDGSFATPEMNSFNHYAYGSVGDWLYKTVAGIDYDINEPGYKHIIFRPLPCKALGYAKARIITDNGDIISGWEYTGTGNECKFTFTIPNGCHATLYLDNEEYEFESGTYDTVFEYEGV
ncbi:MAG: family 78 glycoside hydrolase catalytic domain [Clostridia bacterium]|nr:family 78 glycoside hydrolase catalytic domain [Clostridia bacterium]